MRPSLQFYDHVMGPLASPRRNTGPISSTRFHGFLCFHTYALLSKVIPYFGSDCCFMEICSSMDRVPLPLCITFWKICESFSFFSVYLQKLLCSLFERFEIDRRKLLFYTYFLIPTFNLYCEYIYENESIKNFIYVLLKNCVIDYPLKYTIFCLQFKWLINFVIVRVNIEESIPKQK